MGDVLIGGIFPSGGSYSGVLPPIIASGHALFPPHLVPSSYTLTATAARYYTVPFYIPRATTFAGVKFRNSGAGNNGHKVKIAFFNELAGGGPGTLAKSFGESTLTGAAAIRTLTSSWAATPGWYYGEIVADNAVAFNCMITTETISGVGHAGVRGTWSQLPPIADNVLSGNFGPQLPYGAEYVGGTYANFPEASSLTPTTTVQATNGGGAGEIPSFCLYV